MTTIRIEPTVVGTGLNKWEFSAGWTHDVSGTWSYSATTNATAIFRFRDAAIDFFTRPQANLGIVGISVDYGPEELIDLYGSAGVGAITKVWSLPYKSGIHVVTLRVTGTRRAASTGNFIGIDAMDVNDVNPVSLVENTLANVLVGVSEALWAIPGLRVHDFPPASVQPPAAVLSLPETPYDVTLGGRSDQWTFPLWVLVSKADDRASYGELTPYLEAEGIRSIRQAIESDRTLGGACDTCAIINARPQIATVGGTEFLAIEFTLEVYT